MINTKEDKILGTVTPNINGQNLQIEVPAGTSVLYSDMVNMTVNDFGVVFDFGQRMGPTNKVSIVSRIGMSRGHAEALLHLLETELKKK